MTKLKLRQIYLGLKKWRSAAGSCPGCHHRAAAGNGLQEMSSISQPALTDNAWMETKSMGALQFTLPFSSKSPIAGIHTDCKPW